MEGIYLLISWGRAKRIVVHARSMCFALNVRRRNWCEIKQMPSHVLEMLKIKICLLYEGPRWLIDMRASPPCCVKGTWQALRRGLGEKPAPPLSNPAALIVRALQTSGSTHYPRGWALLLLHPHSGASSTCDSITFGNQEQLHGIFMIIFWVDEPVCK